jgi:hypothetical protein
MIYGYKITKTILSVVLIGLIFTACNTPDPASLFDENYQPKTPPVISSVTPADQFFAGYQEIVIQGQNFSTNLSELAVYFNAVRAEIISATPTQILVRTPNYVADSIGIKVRVLGVESFSNSWRYKLESLFEDVIVYPPNENPWAATIDNAGNYYASIELSGAPGGVRKYASNGSTLVESFSPLQSWFYRSAKIGPDGGVYLVRGGAVSILYRVPPEGGIAASFASGIGRTEDVVFDASGNAWTAGTNENNATNARLNRVNQARVVTRFPFNAQIYALAYANNQLYIAGTRGTDSYIWKVELLADAIPGAEVEVVNLTAAGIIESIPPTNTPSRPTALAVSADGTIFVGMNGSRPLFEVSPIGQVTQTYPGIIPGSILKMEYINDTQRILMTLLPFEGNRNRVVWLNVQRDAP